MVVRYPGLMKRGNVFYLRRLIKGKDRWCSLRTGDLETAQRRAKVISAKLMSQPQPQTPSDAAERWLQDALAADAQYRQRQPARTEEEIEDEVEVLDHLLGDLRRKLATGRMTPAAHAMLLAQIKALEVTRQRSLGRWDDAPAAEAGPVLSAIFEKYLTEKQLTSQTMAEWSLAVRRFISVVGDLPVAVIKKEHVRRWKEHMMSTTKPRKLSLRSIAENMAALGSVLSWSSRNGYCDSNAVAGLPPSRSRREDGDRIMPYSQQTSSQAYCAGSSISSTGRSIASRLTQLIPPAKASL